MAGPTIVAVLLALQVRAAPDPPAFARWIVLVGVVGAFVDTGLGLAGLFTFRPDLLPAWVCPPWLFFLWMIFGSVLPNALAWLADSPRLAAGLGAAGGPLSYYAGAELGALRLSDPPELSLLVLACVWGLLMPGLFILMKRGVARSPSSGAAA